MLLHWHDVHCACYLVVAALQMCPLLAEPMNMMIVIILILKLDISHKQIVMLHEIHVHTDTYTNMYKQDNTCQIR